MIISKNKSAEYFLDLVSQSLEQSSDVLFRPTSGPKHDIQFTKI